MKVVRIIDTFCPLLTGGRNIHVLELSKYINKYIDEQIIISRKVDCRDFDNTLKKDYNIDIIRIKSNRLKKRTIIPVKHLEIIPLLLYSYPVIIKLKRHKRIDIIHAHGINEIIVARIIGTLIRTPVVGMVHGSISGLSKKSGLYESIAAKLFKPDFGIILDDGSIAKNKFKKIWNKKSIIVNHAIDVKHFSPRREDKDIRNKYGIQDRFSIIFTGNLIKFKRVDLLVEIINILVNRNNLSVSLMILGLGDELEKLKKKVKLYNLENVIIFVGKINYNEMPKYLSSSDVFAATSDISNLNRSVQEAMACEIPVVAFNSGGTGNLIKNNYNGISVENKNIEKFAEAIVELYNNNEKRKILGKNAREFIIKNRSWDARVKQELQVYKSLLG